MIYEGLKFRVHYSRSILNKVYTISNIKSERADISWYDFGEQYTTSYMIVDINEYFEEGSWETDKKSERLIKLKKLNEI